MSALEKPLDGAGLAVVNQIMEERLGKKQDAISAGDGTSISGDSINVITPVRGVLTQAEYDALPETQKNKGLYIVDDGETPQAPKEIYSLNEQVVGTWIDGRPVYQKTEIIEVNLDIGYAPILEGVPFDFLIDASGRVTIAANENSGTPAVSCTIGTSNDATEGTQIIQNPDIPGFQSKLLIGEESGGGFDVKYFVTFKYTKTTDPAPTQEVAE